MKKKLIICWLLVLVMCLSVVFVACNNGAKVSDEILAECQARLKSYYSKDSAETSVDYRLVGSTPSIFDEDGTEWTVKVSWKIEGSDQVTVSETVDGDYEVKVPADVKESINYKVIGTLVNDKGEAYKDADGKEYTVTLERVVPGGKGQGTLESPYSVQGLLAEYATLTVTSDSKNYIYSDEMVYVKGIIVEDVSYSSKYSSYTTYIADSADSTSTVQLYSCKLASGVTAPNKNDTVVAYGYVVRYGATNTKMEITFRDGTESGKIVSCEQGTSSITVKDNPNAEVTLDKTSGKNGTDFSFTVASKNGYEISAVKVNGETVTAVDGKYTAKIAGDTEVEVVTSKPIEGATTVTVDMTTNFATYAANWSSSYVEHTLTSGALGVDNVAFDVVIANANKSSLTITDMPVLRPNDHKAPHTVTIKVTGVTIASVTFNLQEWGASKKFGTLTIEYSTDGTTWTATNVGVVDNADGVSISGGYKTLTYSELPEGVTQVRLVVNNTSSKPEYSQQVGFAGFSIVVK